MVRLEKVIIRSLFLGVGNPMEYDTNGAGHHMIGHNSTPDWYVGPALGGVRETT